MFAICDCIPQEVRDYTDAKIGEAAVQKEGFGGGGVGSGNPTETDAYRYGNPNRQRRRQRRGVVDLIKINTVRQESKHRRAAEERQRRGVALMGSIDRRECGGHSLCPW